MVYQNVITQAPSACQVVKPFPPKKKSSKHRSKGLAELNAGAEDEEEAECSKKAPANQCESDALSMCIS
jgi:hypothetical protein